LIFCVLSVNSLLRVFTIPNFCLIFCVLSANSLLRQFSLYLISVWYSVFYQSILY
jgi:hypothetical protein